MIYAIIFVSSTISFALLFGLWKSLDDEGKHFTWHCLKAGATASAILLTLAYAFVSYQGV